MEQLRKIQKMGTAVQVISIICIVFLAIAIATVAACIAALIAASIAVPAEYQTLDMALDLQLTLDHPLFAQMDAESFTSENLATYIQDSAMIFNVASDTIPCHVFNIWAIFVTPLLQLIAWLIVLCHVSRFAKTLKRSHAPFTSDVVRRLKKIGWSLVFAATLPSVIGGFVSAFVLSGDVKLAFDINLPLVLLVLIFLLLIYIFSYGVELQEESDTTL